MSPFDLTRTLPADAMSAALRADVREGLTHDPKQLPPKWFYDAQGSELFEEITRLPEYYPTRAEREILEERAKTIADITRARTLVELGSGSSEKTRLLIDALGTPLTYIPVDVSESALNGAGRALLADHPGLTVHALVADFQRGLELSPTPGPRLVAFLGGTIGNLLPEERAAFLASARAMLAPEDTFLLGTDLVKDEATLVAAYDDAQGVTAAFNKNVLTVIDRELGADFDPADFDHLALWDRENEWIEMRLRARRDLTVKVPALDLTADFAAGEEMRTEVSAKFREEGIRAELAAAGMRLRHWWTDRKGRFALSLASPASPEG
ncbi:L-histidine N(alpha)-methyltransferase [Actinacidiphila soli]|uniref:L-histidine N(alpha)-methyltransferase n=1 Tax=Actinacidiphila soli TaxID=2487275 RepID=UPI000FC9B869|nr:L-histidine N(alpha)-methyltransferase [Actinacidiphila soli]